MPYRRSPRYERRIRAMQEGRKRARMAREMQPRWEQPALRRRLTVEDFDTGETKTTVFELFGTRRIDTYQVAVNGSVKGRMGWSKLLELLRVALPRKCSPRHFAE